MRSLCILVLLVWINDVRSTDPPICAGRNVTSQPVIDFCNAQENSTLILRCCFTGDFKSILAVDMVNLNLTQVPDFTQTSNLDARVIDLRENPQMESTSSSDFVTLTALKELYLPNHFDCPGGARVWEWINKTTDPLGNLCIQQTDFCTNATDTCTDPRSYCSVNGPNHFLCLCKSGYHGYKCLREGTFPAAAFLGSTIGVTVVASVLLYWTQRRHVRK